MTVESYLSDLEVVAEKAIAFPKRRSDAELYGILAAMLHLCNRADQEGILEELKSAALEKEKRIEGKHRAYFESGADAPLIVGRLVFAGVKRRDSVWRYTSTLRRARELQIQPQELASWLNTNGGINALFKSRQVEKRTRHTKTLNLLDQVELPKEGLVQLTLRDNGAGFYHVVDQKNLENS